MENKKQIKTEKQKQKHYEIIHLKNEMLGIPKEIENTYNYLYYSWKRANAFYSLLYDKFINDYNKEEFGTLCYIAIYNSKERRNIGKLGACKAITGRVDNYTKERPKPSRKTCP